MSEDRPPPAELVPAPSARSFRPADDRGLAAEPIDIDVPGGGGPSPLLILARRWPLLLVGLLAGLVVGALIHFSTAPTYESRAQVLVIKKRVESSQNDTRMAMVEDYVATQVTLLKSEKIRAQAAILLKDAPLRNPLPADERDAANALAGGLSVARDRDTGSAGGTMQVGSGVLLLTYRGANPGDTRLILEKVIDAYQQVLDTLYDRATADRLKFLDTQIKLEADREKKASTDQLAARHKLGLITSEDVPGIRSRLTANKTKEAEYEGLLIGLEQELTLIAKAGQNQRDRMAVLHQLTGRRESGTLGVGGSADLQFNPEAAIRANELRLQQLGKLLGPDHPQMKALSAQIELQKAAVRQDNPDPNAKVDALELLAMSLRTKKDTLKLQLDFVKTKIANDARVLSEADGVQGQIDYLATQVAAAQREQAKLQSDRQTTQATQGAGGYTTSSITPPAEGYKVAPVLAQSLLMGLAVGLLLGGGAIVLAEYSDRGFRSPAEIRRRLGLPIIGHLPQLRVDQPADSSAPENLKGQPTLVTALRPKSAESEGYRGVRTQLYFSTQGRGHQVIQVTSPNPGDGKSTLAANLAISVAQSGKRVVLMDCDFRKPRIHKLFNVTTETGLAKVVSGQSTLAEALQKSGVTNLDLLPCGPRPSNPAELLTSPDFQRVLAELRAAYDFVIIDTPPMLAVSDPAAVAPRADGVILVFRLTNKARPSAERAREQLTALGANVLGVVVNGWTGSQQAGGYYGYNYGYGYGYGYGYNYGYGYRYSDYEYADNYDDTPSGEIQVRK